MLQTSNEPIVHSYDVEHHAIRCGVPGHPTSSKHPRSVTCPECLRKLAVVRDLEPRR